MPGNSTLIVTTKSGVRPLGVRGEPLHNAAPQLRRVVRRRLGDAAADLMADPQLHEDGTAIDWHAGWPGAVQPVTELEPARRGEVLAEVDRLLAEIRRLGDALASTGPREDTGLVGLSLKLAARAPSPSFIFLVGDRPVIVAWGYEKEAAAALLPLAIAPAPGRRSVLDPQQSPPPPSPQPSPSLPALLPAATTIPWARSLVAALPLLLLVLGGAWLLRGYLPIDPALTLVTREGPPAPPAPPAPHDSLPLLRASLSTETSQGKILQVELSLVEAELKKRIAECKPPEPPKELPKDPPQAAVAPPPPPPVPPKAAAPPPAPPKAAAPTPPPAQPRRPGDDRLRLPAPTNNMSFLAGCWRTDPFRHERNQPQAGVSSYCFDANGNGQLEWRRGRTACRTRAQGRFEGAVLRLRDADTTCNDGSRWYADQLTCQRGADDVAQCSGSSRGGAFGPTAWTVNLHKLN
jgi:hypothetical protein